MKGFGRGILGLVLLAALLLAVPALAQSRGAVVTAKSVTVYAKPKASSRELGVLSKGAQVTVTAVKGAAAQIQYGGGVGYVKKSALKLQEKQASATPAPAKSAASAASATVKKTQQKAVAYLEPSTSCKDKTTVRKGTSFSILGSQGDFYKVERSGIVAYVLKSAFQAAEKTAPSPSPTPTPAPATKSRQVQSDSQLYQEADKSAKVLAQVEAGDTVQVVRQGKRFAQVYYQDEAGYLPLSAFKQAEPTPSPAATPAPAKAKQTDSAKADKVVAAALVQLGKPYVYGATGMSSFDCSGLTRYAYGLVGISLPHSAYAVGYSSGEKVERTQLRKGDIVCFNTISDGDQSDHVGIYIGSNQFVHASSGQRKVVISSLSGYYLENFSWGRRVL